MIVYSVQTLSMYHAMRNQWTYAAPEEHIAFPTAYRWMKRQTERLLGVDMKEGYPIWLWAEHPNRNHSSLLSKGTRGVILTLDIPEESIVWSSFEDWHAILNQQPLVHDDAEWEDYVENDWSFNRIEATWERLFDVRWLASRPVEFAGEYSQEQMQGVTPFITMDMVEKVTRFIAK